MSISKLSVSQNKTALDRQLGIVGQEIKKTIFSLDPSAVFHYSLRKIFIETDLSEIQVKETLNTKFENSSWGWKIQNVVKTEGMVEIDLLAISSSSKIQVKESFQPFEKQLWGVLAEEVKIDDFIPFGSTVLDVGSGDGTITQRIRDERYCHVKALEPDINCLSQLQAKLGPGNVDALTLQDAVEKGFYQKQFDYVTVFKYNVPLAQKDSFCAVLAKAVKPKGLVIIHSVEKERLYFSKNDAHLYLLDELKKHFNDVQVESREYGKNWGSRDGLIKCRV